MLLAKTKLHSIKILISKALIDSYLNHDEFISVNNVLKEYNETKEILKLLWKTIDKMLDVSRETYERNGKEAILDGEKHVDEGLDHNNLRESTLKYLSNHTKTQIWNSRNTRIDETYSYRQKISNQNNYGL